MNPKIRQLIQSLRTLVRLHLALGGLARVGAVGVAVAAVSWIFDWWLRFDFGPRGMIGTGAAIMLAVAAWRYLLRPLTRRLTDVDLALVLERATPEFHDRLLTAVQGATSQHATVMSEELLSRVAAEAAEVAPKVRPASALDWHRLWRQLGMGAAGLAVVGAALFWFPHEASIWYQRNVLLRDVNWPRATELSVTAPVFKDGVARVVRGSPLDIVVLAKGRRIPESVRLEFDYEQSGRFRESALAAGKGRFAKHLEAVVENFHFTARAGDGETALLRVETVDPPMLRDVRLRLVYPAYTQLRPREIGPGEGSVEAVIGTEIELRGTANKALKGATLRISNTKFEISNMQTNTVPSMSVSGGTNLVARLVVKESGPVQISLEDVEGLRADRALAFALYAQPDRPPTVRMTLTGIGEKITPQATLPLTAEARDDFGVASINLAWSTNANHWTTQSIERVTANGSESRTETRWPVEPLHLAEGSLLNLRAEAVDSAKPPGRGQSQPLALRVVSAAELLADLNRKQKEYRTEFDRLTRRQREVADSLRLLAENVNARTETPKSLPSLAADEREVGNGCANISELFRRILEEQRNNRVGTPEQQERMRARVVEPLAQVAGQVLGSVLEKMASGQPPSTEAKVAYDRMRTILSEMLQGETLAEAISMLQEILKDQDQLNSSTRKALETEIERLLK